MNRNVKRLFVFTLLVAGPFCSCVSYSKESKIRHCFSDSIHRIRLCIGTYCITHDQLLDDSYRLLLVYDFSGVETTIVRKHYLNVNQAADFSYDIVSEFLQEHGLVIISGYATLYLFDTERLELSEQVVPDYSECAFSDGQGHQMMKFRILDKGTLLEVEVRECGSHLFDIKDLMNIHEICMR